MVREQVREELAELHGEGGNPPAGGEGRPRPRAATGHHPGHPGRQELLRGEQCLPCHVSNQCYQVLNIVHQSTSQLALISAKTDRD